MTRPLKGTHLFCPCCGSPYLSDAQVAVLVALFLVPGGELSTHDLARVTEMAPRAVTRAMSRDPGPVLFAKRMTNNEHARTRPLVAFYSLTPEGIRAARMVTGVGELEAAE